MAVDQRFPSRHHNQQWQEAKSHHNDLHSKLSFYACVLPSLLSALTQQRAMLSVPAEAVPKRILDLMNVEGLTRENVASHLQVKCH